MSVQELARTFITMRKDDEVALLEWARTEEEAFEAYASAYAAPARDCKGCH